MSKKIVSRLTTVQDSLLDSLEKEDIYTINRIITIVRVITVIKQIENDIVL